MNTKSIIDDIERRYTQYSLSDSDTMLYHRTRDYLEFLKSFDIVQLIIDDVKRKNPFTESVYTRDKLGEQKSPREIMCSVGNSREAYVSFLLHYFEWVFRKKNFNITTLYNDAKWICSSYKEYTKKELIRLFQQNTVYPIATYIVDRLRKGQLLCNVLEQFSIRAMRFNVLQGVKNEREVQNKIALYLYDNGNESHREENSGNGNPDFLISDIKGRFVVEVKYVKATARKGIKDLERWTSQLINYMNKYSSYQGVLYVVSEKNSKFEWKGAPSNMSIMNVYIGKLKPNEMTKPQVYEIEVK